MFEDEILSDTCRACIEKKHSFREIFVKEIRELIDFQGHGCVDIKKPANRLQDFQDWEPYTHEDMMTILKLIDYGITRFHFVVDSETLFDIKHNSVSLTTKVEKKK